MCTSNIPSAPYTCLVLSKWLTPTTTVARLTSQADSDLRSQPPSLKPPHEELEAWRTQVATKQSIINRLSEASWERWLRVCNDVPIFFRSIRFSTSLPSRAQTHVLVHIIEAIRLSPPPQLVSKRINSACLATPPLIERFPLTLTLACNAGPQEVDRRSNVIRKCGEEIVKLRKQAEMLAGQRDRVHDQFQTFQRHAAEEETVRHSISVYDYRSKQRHSATHDEGAASRTCLLKTA